MPHLQIDHARLDTLRRLAREYEDDDGDTGPWDASGWIEEVGQLLRFLADQRIELDDAHSKAEQLPLCRHGNQPDDCQQCVAEAEAETDLAMETLDAQLAFEAESLDQDAAE